MKFCSVLTDVCMMVQAVVLDGGRQGLGYTNGGHSMERKSSAASATSLRR